MEGTRTVTYRLLFHSFGGMLSTISDDTHQHTRLVFKACIVVSVCAERNNNVVWNTRA